MIDMDPATGLSRALSRQTADERFEAFGEELQAKMRAGFLALADEFPDRIKIVDGARDADSVASDIARIVETALS